MKHRKTKMFYKIVSLLTILVLSTTLFPGVVIAEANTRWELEAYGSNENKPKWTKGETSNWDEGDWVPHQIVSTSYDLSSYTTFTIRHEYLNGDVFGFDDARDWTFTSGDGLTSVGEGTSTFRVEGPTKQTDSGQVWIEYQVIPTPDFLVTLDRWNDWHLQWDAHLSVTYGENQSFPDDQINKGSSFMSGASLHTIFVDPNKSLPFKVNPFKPEPSLTLEKTGQFDSGTDSYSDVGEQITYSFVIHNTGNVPLTGVTLSDPLLGGFLTVSATTIPVGGTATATATYPITAADILVGYVDNTATADAEETDPISDDWRQTLPQPPPVDEPAINLIKTAEFEPGADDYADPGDVVTYTFTIQNLGNVELTSVTLNDPMLGGLIALPATTIPVGGSIQVSVDYPVTAVDITAGSISNTATADADLVDPDTATAVVDLPGGPPVLTPGINLIKSGVFNPGGNAYADAGDLITYTLTIQNTGEVPLTGVTLTDPLLGGSITLANTTIPVGQSIPITLTYPITAADILAGQVTNLATADSVETDPDSDTVTVSLPPPAPVQNPAINLIKTGEFNPGEDVYADVGDLITYTLTIYNIGNIALTDVTLSDPLLGGTIELSPATIPVNGSIEVIRTYPITAANIAAGSVSNTATADSEQTGSVTSTAIVPLPPSAPINAPAINLTKTGIFDPGADIYASPGELIAFTLNIANVGNTPLTGVTLIDPLLGSAITLPTSTIPVGESIDVVLTYPVTALDITTGSVLNSATADSDQTGPDSASVTVPLPTAPPPPPPTPPTPTPTPTPPPAVLTVAGAEMPESPAPSLVVFGAEMPETGDSTNLNWGLYGAGLLLAAGILMLVWRRKLQTAR